jgi:hypothetical protein
MISKSKPKICKGALAELRMAGDVDHGATACCAHRNNGEWWGMDHREDNGEDMIWIFYSSDLHIFTLSLAVQKAFRRVETKARGEWCAAALVNFGNWCRSMARGDLHLVSDSTQYCMCLRSPWALPGTPTAGTPRNGTPRNGTPRNGTPRKGGGTPRNGEARVFYLLTALCWHETTLVHPSAVRCCANLFMVPSFSDCHDVASMFQLYNRHL